jgi:hypothetical protein
MFTATVGRVIVLILSIVALVFGEVIRNRRLSSKRAARQQTAGPADPPTANPPAQPGRGAANDPPVLTRTIAQAG